MKDAQTHLRGDVMCTLGCGLLYWLRTFYCPGFICCVQVVRQFQNPNTHPKELEKTETLLEPEGAASALAGRRQNMPRKGKGPDVGARSLEQVGMGALPHLEDPQKAVGEILEVPGYFWSGGTEEERGTIYRSQVLR